MKRDWWSLDVGWLPMLAAVLAICLTLGFTNAIQGNDSPGVPQATAGPIERNISAVCLVTASDGSCGSGTIFGQEKGYLWIHTAKHVCPMGGNVKCVFVHRGLQSRPIVGRVVHLARAIDYAVIVVPLHAIGRVTLPCVPLGHRVDMPKAGAVLPTIGCPRGAKPTGELIRVIGYEKGDWRLIFSPTPEHGRSGSAIFSADGSKCLGIIVAFGQDGQGLAITCDQIRRSEYPYLRVASDELPDESLVNYTIDCGPDGCPPRNGFLFRRQQQGSGDVSPWPPGAEQLPTPAPDLTPLIDGQKQQLELMRQLANRPEPAPPIPPVPIAAAPPVDDTARDLARQANGKADALAGKVDKLGSDVSDVKEAVKPLAAIHAKLQADADAGGLKGKIAKDLLDAGSGDEGLRKVLITAGIVLGLVALCAFGVVHLMRTGRGVVGQVVHDAAQRHPENANLQALDAKLTALDARIASQLPGAGVPGAANQLGADVAARMRDMEARLHGLALATPPPAAGPTAAASPPAVASPGTVPQPVAPVSVNVHPPAA